MTNQRPEKKSETLEVRMPHSKKQAFMKACERQGITASEAVRTFVDEYLKRSRRAKLKTIAKDMTMKLLDNPLKTTGSVTALTLFAIAFTAPVSSADDDRHAEPIEPPFVVYPVDLVRQGISGECQATFHVSIDGVPEDIVVSCTDQGFLQATKDAVETLRFEPKIVDGEAVRRKNVEYPIVFNIEVDPEG